MSQKWPAYGTADLSECAFDSSALETAFNKTMLSAAGNALADSIMNDIAVHCENHECEQIP